MTGPGPASGRRWASAILHVDMDAFFVAVEVRRDPSLRGRPVIVGGSGTRGVVAAASYEARAYGVRSAMPSTRARRLCPEALFLPADHGRYAEASARIMAHFADVTPLVEPLSLDEAFLDVTGAQRRLGEPAAIARAIRARIAAEEGLSCSVGVASTKFLAKLASEAAKPSPSPRGPVAGAGVVVVEPGHELAFLHPLPVKALWGVGPATLQRLQRLGVERVADLAALPLAALVGAVGDAHGRHLHALAHNHDPRAVEPDRAAKSVGHEETYPVDLSARADLDREVLRLADGVATRLRRAGVAGRTVTLKVRFGDFTTLTRSRRLGVAVDSALELARIGRELLDKVDLTAGVRLLGISASALEPAGVRQLSLDLDVAPAPSGPGRITVDAPGVVGGTDDAATPGPDGRARPSPPAWDGANDAVEEIRRRFGSAAIGPASLSDSGRLRVVARGRRAWGPSDDAGSDGDDGSPDAPQDGPRR